MTVLGLLLIGVSAGMFGAMLGLGGGFIYVPALVALFSLGQHQAQGTSLVIIVPTMAVAAAVHFAAGRVEWRTATLLAFGAVVGGFLGAEAALAIDPEVLRKMFGGLLAVVAFRMFPRTRRAPHPNN